MVGGITATYAAEQHGTPALNEAGVETAAADGSTGGNLEGKEQRNGIVASTEWAVVTTDASNGSVNSAHDAYSGIGGGVLLANMMTGEVIFGGVGSGLYGMFLFVLLTVFIAGLMVGRTPEYLGKKIEAREVKLVMIGVLVMPIIVLAFTALAIATDYGAPSIYNPGPQGFSETLYAFTSQANNNGSAFAGYTGFLQPNAPGNVGSYGITFANVVGGLALFAGRYPIMIAALAIAGSLATKKVAPPRGGHVPHRHPHLRRPPARRDPDRRRAHLLPRPAPRPNRPGPDPDPVLSSMKRNLIASAIAVVTFTLLFGIVYPLVTTGVAQLVFGEQADGSRIERDGQLVGSSLIGQDFAGDPRYFQSRPSATGYSADVTYFNNLGPNSAKLARQIKRRALAYLELEGRYTPGLDSPADVPVDAATTSASGVDPHISEANALIQANRVAEVRGLDLARVEALIDENTQGRALGFLGEPGVNVLELNLALDEEAPTP